MVPRPKLEIPVPHLTINETYHRDVPANYDLPRSFVRYHKVTAEDFIERRDYVADWEDEQWLAKNSKFGAAAAANVQALRPAPADDDESKRNGAVVETNASPLVSSAPLARVPQLSITHFETMLDVLEKKTGFESIVTLQQAEQFILDKLPQLLQIFPSQIPRARPSGSLPPVTIKTVIQDVYNYWVQKRSKLKRPLLRNYWPVTSTEDTNPHLVFRPREKEKYRLRKKRQNDFASFQKLQQLRNDFDSLRNVLGLVKRREELKRMQTQLQIDLFQQRMSDATDSSGRTRLSTSSKVDVKRALEDSAKVDLQGRKNKRSRNGTVGGRTYDASGGQARASAVGPDGTAQDIGAANIAGRDFGLPAPNFLHPLATRESYVTSWDGTVPNVATYEDSHLVAPVRFRNRPRIGRGGRLCIDRIPLPGDPSVEPPTVITAGKGLRNYAEPKQSLLDLLPKPLNRTVVSRRIESICLAAVKDDSDRARLPVSLDPDENDGEEVLVDANQWLETDDQLWGEERYTLYLN